MSNYFNFRFQEPEEKVRKSLAIFIVPAINLDLIVKALKADVQQNLVPHNVYFVTTKKDSLSYIKGVGSFADEFDSFVGDVNHKLKVLYVDHSGIFRDEKGNEIPDVLRLSLLQAGMLEIFKKRKGLITSSPNYHFVKPSGDHCDKFIRASNLLISGEEVAFLAIALLPYLNGGLKRIYVDTSSISYFISTALLMSGKFTDSLPSIESFESYTAFNQKYDFVEDEHSLIIISATTSGSLAKKLEQETSFRSRQILTCFYSKLPEGQLGLFDISPAVEDDGLISVKSKNCILCERGSRQIRIVGDQFLPETPKHELVVIRKPDFKEERQDFINEFATRKILDWDRASESNASAKEHFFIDVKKVFQELPENLSKDIDKKINKHFSFDIKTAIYLNDEGSKAFSDLLRKRLQDHAQQIRWMSLKDINEEYIRGNGNSVVVIAGAITSGRKLLEVARKLRSINKASYITYFVGFSKLPSESASAQLKKDLELGGYDLVVLRKCPMPRIAENQKTAWNWERDLLEKHSANDPFVETSSKLPIALEDRISQLSNNAGQQDLFLLSPQKSPLLLRPTFAFWQGLDIKTDDATQADVYWTIQAVFHDLRATSDEVGLGSTYHSTLISPACFDRYNDGIIQAAILRAAKPVELNYAVDIEFSRKMTDVLLSIVRGWREEQGEASLEFLMALWTKRMQLAQEHMDEIVEMDSEDMPEEMRFIFAQLKKEFVQN